MPQSFTDHDNQIFDNVNTKFQPLKSTSFINQRLLSKRKQFSKRENIPKISLDEPSLNLPQTIYPDQRCSISSETKSLLLRPNAYKTRQSNENTKYLCKNTSNNKNLYNSIKPNRAFSTSPLKRELCIDNLCSTNQFSSVDISNSSLNSNNNNNQNVNKLVRSDYCRNSSINSLRHPNLVVQTSFNVSPVIQRKNLSEYPNEKYSLQTNTTHFNRKLNPLFHYLSTNDRLMTDECYTEFMLSNQPSTESQDYSLSITSVTSVSSNQVFLPTLDKQIKSTTNKQQKKLCLSEADAYESDVQQDQTTNVTTTRRSSYEVSFSNYFT